MTADPFILRGFCSGIELHSKLRYTTAVIPSLPAAGGEESLFPLARLARLKGLAERHPSCQYQFVNNSLQPSCPFGQFSLP
jgi:hypothetical protein